MSNLMLLGLGSIRRKAAATTISGHDTLPTGLVSYWKLDEASGNAADSKGTNTLTNANVTYVAAKLNNGADFDTTSDQLSIADASQSGLDLSTALSFSVWVKPDTTVKGAGDVILQKHVNGSQQSYRFIRKSDNTLGLYVSGALNGTDDNVLTVIQTLTGLTWYHLVVTWLGSTKTAKFYVNGSQVGADQVGATVTSIANGTAAFVLSTLDIDNWDGVIDELGVWSKVLTSSEITDLYNGGTPFPYN